MQVKKVNKAIAVNVNTTLVQKELTVTGIAAKQNAPSESTIRRLKNAGQTKYTPKLSTLVKLSNTLGVTLDQLLAQ